MRRTTPPRPLDIAIIFPELLLYATTATRLHPRPGNPTASDSSVGGPLHWPAAERWPVCERTDHYLYKLLRPDTVRATRAIYAAARARAAATGQRYDLTDDERAVVPRYDFSEPHALAEEPTPLVPVAQLYRRDVPDFMGPADADLLQVLWCPLDHPEIGYNPRVELRWRRAVDITDVRAAGPEPTVVNESYLPTPCVVHPEQVVEYQYADLLPDLLKLRIRAWEERTGHSYQATLSLAPGWKVGGYANWSLTDPHPMDCGVCGAGMVLLFTADSSEWEGPAGSWRPVEEPEAASVGPTDVVIGRGYALYLFACPRSFEHPLGTTMQ